MPGKRFAAAFTQPKFNPAVKFQGYMTTKTGKETEIATSQSDAQWQRKGCKRDAKGHQELPPWRPKFHRDFHIESADTDTACASLGSRMVPTPPSTPPPPWKRGCITTPHWLQQGMQSDGAVTDADCAGPAITMQPSPPSTPPPFFC